MLLQKWGPGLRQFIKKEPVLLAAAVCAALSLLAVPPDKGYIDYIDLRVLGLLWCLMVVVAAISESGAFRVLSYRLLSVCSGHRRILGLILVLLPFFFSMAVTNDVALLTFVPFTLLLLEEAQTLSAAPAVLVLQTLAANLGSMATPVGNPQNLFLHSYYQLTASQFFSALLPLTALSGLALSVASLWALPKKMGRAHLEPPPPLKSRTLLLYSGLFILCLLAVFRALTWWAAALIILAVTLWWDKGLLKKPDYCLLLTFVCFFIFSGNLGRIEAVRDLLQSLMARRALLTSLLASQVISNVPAAVLLAGFTSDWRGLLLGVDIGGLGTPIASLASLISLKLYLASPNARFFDYLLLFLEANLAGLALLLIASALL